MAPTMNITITVPGGTTNHGDPNLLCTPTKWTDIILFYTVNYMAHAVTVKSIPGEQKYDSAFLILSALLYPYSGLLRGLEAIFRRAAWRPKNELEQAARAGALCIVVRSRDWRPRPGEKIKGLEIVHEKVAGKEELNEKDIISTDAEHEQPGTNWAVTIPRSFYEGLGDPMLRGEKTVHGIQNMPDEYNLAVLPSNAVVHPGHKDLSISSSYNVLSAVISIIQICSASATLYKTRGSQLDEYGYAAFGFTVIPYVIMSIVNFCGNALTPDYPTLYLVRSKEMKEAQERYPDVEFDGIVGSVVEDSSDDVEYEFEAAKDSGYLIKSTRTSVQGQDTANTATNIEEDEPTKAPNHNVSLVDTQVAPNSTYHIAPTQKLPDARGYISITSSMKPSPKSTSTQIAIPTHTPFLTSGTKRWGPRNMAFASNFMLLIIIPMPYIVIGILTHFKPKNSTKAQRVWTMGWLAFGTFIGAYIPVALVSVSQGMKERDIREKEKSKKWKSLAVKLYGVMFYSVFAFGAWVVVGQELFSYGSCNALT